MRSAERVALVGALVLLGGCSTVSRPLEAIKEAVASVPLPGSAASAPAAAPTPALSQGGRESLAPVAAGTQRAFDDAVRLLKAGRVDEAERGFKALVQSNPELGGPHANLGLIYRRAGKLPEAATQGEEAIKASPQQAAFWNQLGITYRHQGQFAKAREAYEKAIALDPNEASAHLNLGILHDLYLGDGKRALELYDRYLALQPAGDATVNKWVVDLRNRKPQVAAVNRKEKE